jgi:hypothetical protein
MAVCAVKLQSMLEAAVAGKDKGSSVVWLCFIEADSEHLVRENGKLVLDKLSKAIVLPCFDTGIVQDAGMVFNMSVHTLPVCEDLAVVYLDAKYVEIDHASGAVTVSFTEWSAVVKSICCGAD